MKKPIIFLLTTFSREYGSYLVTTDSVLLPERLPLIRPVSRSAAAYTFGAP